MKIKIEWFVNCAFAMPAIGFALLLFTEFVVIGFGEEKRCLDTGGLVMIITLFIGILMALLGLALGRHNKDLRGPALLAIMSNTVIIILVAAIVPCHSIPAKSGSRIKMLQKRLAKLPPPDDGRTPKGDYMVIDLNGGMEASSYSITNLTAMPLGGWTDEYKTTKLVLRKIPKGTFVMGDRSTDYPDAEDVGLHSVTLTKDFYIGVFEVTQRQWELVMGNRPSYFTNSSCYASRPVEWVSYYEIRENPLPVIDVYDPGYPGRQDAGSDDPAVDWPSNSMVNAFSFMGKLRARTGLLTLDLPTEAQWEYACRAGTTTALNTGYNRNGSNIDPRMDVAGRYAGNGANLYGAERSVDTFGGTAKVGSYLPNTWGLYDMHGNVQEWCLDWYGASPQPPDAQTDPEGAASGCERVTRGGDCFTPARCFHLQSRFGIKPVARINGLGFRAALTLSCTNAASGASASAATATDSTSPDFAQLLPISSVSH
jgi:formylglycine-generating enzyme required for sulfatase activity